MIPPFNGLDELYHLAEFGKIGRSYNTRRL